MNDVVTDIELKANLAANLSRLLAARGITPYRMAKRIGEPLNTVYRIVRGENVPNAVLVARMAECLDVTTDELLDFPEKHQKRA